jgi:hypothetical protein
MPPSVLSVFPLIRSIRVVLSAPLAPSRHRNPPSSITIDTPIAPVALINILRETLAMILRRNCRPLAGGRLPAKNPGSLLWIAVFVAILSQST